MRKFFVTALAAVLCIAGNARQMPFSVKHTDTKPPSTLSEVAENQLVDPKVLSALSLTPEQVLRGALRMVVEPVHKLALAKANSAGDNDKLWENLSITTDLGNIHVSDLSPSQKRRLYEITLQTDLVSSLITDEIGFAMHLSDTQRKKLGATYAVMSEKQVEAFKAAIQRPEVVKMGAELQKLGASESDPTSEEVDKVFGALIRIFPKVLATAYEAELPAQLAANRQALALLTVGQRKILRRLQGHPFKH